MTVREATEFFRHELTVESPRIEITRLLCEVLNVTSGELSLCDDRKLDQRETGWLAAAVQRRNLGEPLAYILGHQGFYKHQFIVRPGVLIPRPETEGIVEIAFEKPALEIADFGCGSGCIGLSILKEWQQSRLTAIDASNTAIEVTRENAAHLNLIERCEFVLARVEEWKPLKAYDLIVANPPYIGKDDPHVEENVRKYEPFEALFAGNEGLAAIESWIKKSSSVLKRGGRMIMEVGAGQSESVATIMKESGFSAVAIHKDLAGIDRVLSAIRSEHG